MRIPALVIAAATLCAAPALAVDEDACDKQRASFPKDWSDVGGEKELLGCGGHYVRLVIRARKGPRMPIVSVELLGDHKVYRAEVTDEQLAALKAGKRVDLFLRSPDTCFIR